MPKLVVKLKQYTPVMHFQTEEPGATIRGTELKPALDRFLLRYAREEFFPNGVRNKAMFMGDTDALNYRVTIVVNDVRDIEITEPSSKRNATVLKNTPFFAMGGAPETTALHNATLTNAGVKMTFISNNTVIIDTIAEWIARFFAVNNFGFRKGKGFGSFCVTQIGRGDKAASSDCIQQMICDVLKLERERKDSLYEMRLYEIVTDSQMLGCMLPRYASDIDNNYAYKWFNIMRIIHATYSAMKSGINYPALRGFTRYYYPSVLMKKYAYNRRYSNSKRKMKLRITNVINYNKLYDNESGASEDVVDYGGEKDYRFARAMLGLADHYDFNLSRISVKVADAAPGVTDDNRIQRFESPLLFKPVLDSTGWRVFILLRTIPDDMFGHTFRFSEGSSSFELDTPNKDEFSLIEFMDCVEGQGLIRTAWLPEDAVARGGAVS